MHLPDNHVRVYPLVGCLKFDVQTDIENRYRVVLIIGYFVR